PPRPRCSARRWVSITARRLDRGRRRGGVENANQPDQRRSDDRPRAGPRAGEADRPPQGRYAQSQDGSRGGGGWLPLPPSTQRGRRPGGDAVVRRAARAPKGTRPHARRGVDGFSLADLAASDDLPDALGPPDEQSEEARSARG